MVLFEPIEDKQILDLVKFEDVLITYNKNYNLIINFTLAPELKGSTLDWIGIFQGGWNKYESFLSFEWGIGEPVDNNGRKRRMIFDSKYLQNAKPNTPYQFVYISKHLEILGVSQFFQFIGDDPKNDSFCLKASFLLSNDIHNSTEYQEKSEEFSELVNNETVSSIKKARAACSINLPDNWEQAFTTCWRCKSLFEMKNKHNALIEKLNLCSEQNEQLKERVHKLETALQNAWIPQTLINPWSDDQERSEYKHFVSVMTESDSPCANSFEKGDHWGDQNALVKCEEPASSAYDFMNEGTSKELLLKAIIGNQEHRIRELNRKVNEMNGIIFQTIPRSVTNTDVVTLVRTKEKVIPELVNLKNSEDDEEKIVDNLDQNMNIEENRNLESQGPAGDTLIGFAMNDQISLD